jgi:hypothetical protein
MFPAAERERPVTRAVRLSPWLWASTAVAWLLLHNAVLSAQDLAWKFTAGDQWLVVHTGETTSATTVNGKTTKDRLQTELHVRWKIDSVNDGIASVTQEITRLKLVANSEAAADVLYDSSDPEKPTGAAKDVATVVQPLLGAKLAASVNAQGEVSNITAGSDFPKTTAGGKANGWVLSLLEQPLAFLPGKTSKVEETWERTRGLDLPLGQFDQTQRYQLTSFAEDNALAEIAVAVSLKLKGGSSKTIIKEQSLQGTLKFDTAAGRLRESETTQRLLTSTPYRGGEIVVKTQSVSRIVVTKE